MPSLKSGILAGVGESAEYIAFNIANAEPVKGDARMERAP
jgi:hypothetical protein